ncbi:MAG TPA: sialidase family protein [Bacillota bacterium]|nr:sialidase family protein [Bacillota bacterium]
MQWISEVKYQHPATRTYLGSPSLLRLFDNTLIASHDYFGPGCPKNHEGEEFLTSIYRSEDNGLTWQEVNHIAGAFWSSLFAHRGAIYLLGTSAQYGSIVIRRSEDGGYTWTEPTDAETGLLFRGGSYHTPPNYHCAPMPVVEYQGRLYRAFEDNPTTIWPQDFLACVISCSVDADLLQAENWQLSSELPYPKQATPSEWAAEAPGWLEGNIVPAPGGKLWNILRVNSKPAVDKAAIVEVEDQGRKLSFKKFIDFPGGMSKFTIRQDPKTGLYLTLTNNNTVPEFPNQRNVLSLYASRDLETWFFAKTIMEEDQPIPVEESLKLTGFQYPDWQFDGEALILLVRAAYKGANNYHDANRIVFSRIEDFRSLTPTELRDSDSLSRVMNRLELNEHL